MTETEEFIFGFVLVVAVFGVLIFMVCRTLRPAQKEEARKKPKPERLCFTATVTGMRCGVKLVGIKTPKAVKEFVVTFESKEFGTFVLPVPEANYDGFEKGQTGKLTLVNGQLYSFTLED